MSENEYYIWSNEHNSWWRANSQGYCSRIENAGLYSKEEAIETCNGANFDWNTDSLKKIPSELPIHKDIALTLIHKSTYSKS